MAECRIKHFLFESGKNIRLCKVSLACIILASLTATVAAQTTAIRGWDFVSWDPSVMNGQIDLATNYDINYIDFSDNVISSFSELEYTYNGVSAATKAQDLQQWCAHAASNGMDAIISVSPFKFNGTSQSAYLPSTVLTNSGNTLLWDQPALWQWFSNKINMVFTKVPSATGISITVTEGQWQFNRVSTTEFSIKGNAVPFDPSTTEDYVQTALGPAQRLAQFITVANNVCQAMGKKLIIHDFWRTPNEHYELWQAMQQVPTNVVVFTKHLPNDFRYQYPPSPSLGTYTNRVQIFEYELGDSSSLAVDYYRQFQQLARNKGMQGNIIRCMPLDIDDLRLFTLYVVSQTGVNPDADLSALYASYWKGMKGLGDDVAYGALTNAISQRFDLFLDGLYALRYGDGTDFEFKKTDQRLHVYAPYQYADSSFYYADLAPVDLSVREGNSTTLGLMLAQKTNALSRAGAILASLQAVQSHFSSSTVYSLISQIIQGDQEQLQDQGAFLQTYYTMRYYRNHPGDANAKQAAWTAWNQWAAYKASDSSAHGYDSENKGILTDIDSGTLTDEPPATPTNFGVVTSQQAVVLSWQDNSATEQYYVVERKEAWPGIYHIVQTLPANSTNWTDTTIQSGNRYTYRVHAFRNAGESYYSAFTPALVVDTSATSATPIFAPPGGTYAVPQSVTITCATAGASIYYTTDGSTPATNNGTFYFAPVIIASNTTLQALAYTNLVSSAVSTASYVITGTNIYTISASAGANGSISPSGAVAAPAGTNLTFTVTPAGGYAVQNVLVDGSSIGSVTSYTFNAVVTNHTISANFASALPVSVIAVVDAPLAHSITNVGTAMSASVTVSSGANVLVALLASTGGKTSAYSDPATLSWNGQTLNRVVSGTDNTSTYRNASIYYLINPTPGTATLTGSEPATTNFWALKAYTLSGVDTTVSPLIGSAGGSGTSSLSLNVAGCPNNGFAVVCATWSASSLSPITFTGTGGTATTTTEVTSAGSSASDWGMGYISGLTPAGTDVFQASVGIANKCAFAAAVFTPLQAGLPQPRITSIVLSGTNLLISGTNGTSSGSYSLLTTTNLTLPLSQWITNATSKFDASGNFSFTNGINPNRPQQFYLFKTP